MQIIQDQYLHAYLRSLEDSLENTIQTTPDAQLLSSSEDSYIESLIQKYTVIPIQLHLEQAEITTHQKQVYARDLPLNIIGFGRGINPNDPRPLLQKALEPVQSLWTSSLINAKTTICKLVLVFLSQFFHNLRHFSSQAKERSATQRFEMTTNLCNSLRFATSTVAPSVSFIAVENGSPV